ncbi:MAG: hypothetical protein K2O18_17410 [Oscillospiraceae bacterium]|nr:hypothetical protein [Oscillospiraceae bacterium]
MDAECFYWIQGPEDDPEDLCLHGDVTAVIGDETFSYACTASAAALYLLKSLSRNHIIYEENQMLPCCGFFMIANDTLSEVDIVGCSNGIDWSVIHEDGAVRLVTESGKETVVPMTEYQKEVLRFAGKVEAYYRACAPKILPEDEFDRNGYTAFWNEWRRRTAELS